MPQFFVDKKIEPHTECAIRGGDARHITGSLRLGPGDSLVISDGRGASFNSRIVTASPGSVLVRILDQVQRARTALPPTLAIAAVRSERLELAVSKAVELGCRSVIIFNSKRTVRAARDQSGRRRMQRLARIAAESAKQSGLPFVPQLAGPLSFEELCARLGEFEPAVMMHEAEQTKGIRAAVEGLQHSPTKPALIMIGPEGGFSEEEVSMALSSGAVTAGMGPQILRAETAAIAAFTIFQYELGSMETAGST